MVGANESDTARTQQPTTQPLSTRERRQIEKAKSKHEKARVKAARKESKRQSKIKRKQSKSSNLGDVPNTEELPRHDEKLLPLEAPVGEEALPQTQNHATDPSDTPLPTASPAVVDDPSLPVAERLGRSRQKLARVKNGEGLAIVTEMFGTVDTTLRGRGRTQEWELGARADRIQAPRNDVRTLPLTVEAVAQLGSTRTGEWWSSGSISASPARTADACSLLDVDGAGSAVDAVDTDACSLLDEDTEGRGDDTHPEMAWAPAMFRAADSFDGVSIDLAEAAMIMQLLFEKKQGTKFGPEVQTVAVQVLSKFCAGRPAKASRVLLTEFLRLVADFRAVAEAIPRKGRSPDGMGTPAAAGPEQENVGTGTPDIASIAPVRGAVRVVLPYSPTGYGFRLKNEGHGYSFDLVRPGSLAAGAGLHTDMRIAACNGVDVSLDTGFGRLEELFEGAAHSGHIVLDVIDGT